MIDRNASWKTWSILWTWRRMIKCQICIDECLRAYRQDLPSYMDPHLHTCLVQKPRKHTLVCSPWIPASIIHFLCFIIAHVFMYHYLALCSIVHLLGFWYYEDYHIPLGSHLLWGLLTSWIYIFLIALTPNDFFYCLISSFMHYSYSF